MGTPERADARIPSPVRVAGEFAPAYAPTKAQRDVADILLAAIDGELAKFEAQKAGAVAEFNALARELETPYVK